MLLVCHATFSTLRNYRNIQLGLSLMTQRYAEVQPAMLLCKMNYTPMITHRLPHMGLMPLEYLQRAFS